MSNESPRFRGRIRVSVSAAARTRRVTSFHSGRACAVVDHIQPGFFACPVRPSRDPLTFQQIERALFDRVVMVVPTVAHQLFPIVSAMECCPVHAVELVSLFGVE